MQQNSFPIPSEPCAQIPIHCSNIANLTNEFEGYTPTVQDEWQIIELQGNITSRPEKNKPLDSVVLGQLSTKTSSGKSQTEKCELLIGRQKCEGKTIPLKKPLVVLEKITSNNNIEHKESNMTVSYRVVGIVREKLLFANRPIPLSPPEKNKVKSVHRLK